MAGYPYVGEVVFSCRDEHGVIDVVDESGLRSLQFASGARQSMIFLHDPDVLVLSYTHCMMTSLLFRDGDPQRALLLGVGGGSLVRFLVGQLPEVRLDAVEKRAKVLEVARSHFGMPDDPRLQLHVDDGMRFLQEGEPGRWDLMFIDLHDSEGMAPVVRHPDFFAACRRGLSETGMLAINLWYGYRDDDERLVRDNLESHFPGRVVRLPVAGKRNCIALASPTPLERDRAVLGKRAAAWQARCGLDLPGLLDELWGHNPERLAEAAGP